MDRTQLRVRRPFSDTHLAGCLYFDSHDKFGRSDRLRDCRSRGDRFIMFAHSFRLYESETLGGAAVLSQRSRRSRRMTVAQPFRLGNRRTKTRAREAGDRRCSLCRPLRRLNYELHWIPALKRWATFMSSASRTIFLRDGNCGLIPNLKRSTSHPENSRAGNELYR